MTWTIAMDIVSQLSRKQDRKKLQMIPSSNSIGRDLDYLDAERSIKSHPNDNVKRRTLLMRKINDSWGFTLQSYGIKHKKTNEIEIMTYVDYIEITGPAYMAGMRKGDVILSVNGQTVDKKSHKELVAIIKSCQDSMRLVVMFEDCCKRVELHDRIFRLKDILAHKKMELKELELKEREIIDEFCQSKGLSRFDRIRQSMISTVSSTSWDRYSYVQPQLLEFPVPHLPSKSKTSIEGDNSSSMIDDLDDSYISYEESDADSGMCICCPSIEDKIPMKMLKDPDEKSSNRNCADFQNGIIPTKELHHGKKDNEETQRSSVPFVSSDFVYINEKDECTEL